MLFLLVVASDNTTWCHVFCCNTLSTVLRLQLILSLSNDSTFPRHLEDYLRSSMRLEPPLSGDLSPPPKAPII